MNQILQIFKSDSLLDGKLELTSKLIFRILLVVFCLLFSQRIFASHVAGMEVSYRHIEGEKYEFELNVYRDCFGIDLPDAYNLQVESGICRQRGQIHVTLQNITDVSPTCQNLIGQTTCNGGTYPGMQRYRYTGEYVFPSKCADWKISANEWARNYAIINIVDELAEIYVETTLNNLTGPNNSTNFGTLPVVYTCSNQEYIYDQQSFDADGDSLVFAHIAPLIGENNEVTFQTGLSENYPIYDVRGANQFDPLDGSLSIVPSVQASYVTAFYVREYRNGMLVGSTIRDVQIVVVSDCSGIAPEDDKGLFETGNGVRAGSDSTVILVDCRTDDLSFSLQFSDSDLQDTLNIRHNVFELFPYAILDTVGVNPLKLNVAVPIDSLPNLDQTYVLNIQVLDNSCPLPNQSFFSYKIVYEENQQEVTRICIEDTTYLLAKNILTPSWVSLSDTSVVIGTADSLKVAPEFDIGKVQSFAVTPVGEEVNCITSAIFNVVTKVPLSPTLTAQDTVCFREQLLLDLEVTPYSPKLNITWSPSLVYDTVNVLDRATWIATNTDFKVLLYDDYYCTIDSVEKTVAVNPNSLIDVNLVREEDNCKGDTLNLQAYKYDILFTDVFDTSYDTKIWSSVSGGGIDIRCYDTVTALAFNGAGIRNITSIPLNLSNGALLRYDIEFATDYMNCNAPSSGREVVLEYSLDGIFWKNLDTVEFEEGINRAWLELTLPPVAWSDNTRIRWSQGSVNSAYRDLWYLHQVVLSTRDTSNPGFQWSTVPNFVSGNDTQRAFVLDNNVIVSASFTDTISGCVLKDSLKIAPTQPFHITSITPDSGLCNDVGLFLKVETSRNDNLSIQWTPTDYLNDPNSFTTFSSPLLTITYQATVTSEYNCFQDIASTRVYVARFKNKVILDQNREHFCKDDTTRIVVNVEPQCGAFGTFCDTTFEVKTPNSNDTTSRYQETPFAGDFVSSKKHYLFPINELNAIFPGTGPRTITSLSVYVDGINGDSTYQRFKVDMACTPESEFDLEDTVFSRDLINVVSPKDLIIHKGWNKIVFDKAYDWDGESSLKIEVCYYNDELDLADRVRVVKTAYACVLYSANHNETCVNDVNAYLWSTRPIMKFDYCDQVPLDSVSVEWVPDVGINYPDSGDVIATMQPDTTNYIVYLTDELSGCRYSSGLTLGPPPYDQVLITQDTSNCIIDSFIAPIFHTFEGNYQVQWQSNPNLSSLTSDTTYINLNGGDSIYYVTITDEYNCVTLSDSVMVKLEIPRDGIVLDTGICYLDTLKWPVYPDTDSMRIEAITLVQLQGDSLVMAPKFSQPYVFTFYTNKACVIRDSIYATSQNPPIADTLSQILCVDSVLVDVPTEDETFIVWWDGNTNNPRAFDQLGVVHYAYINSCGIDSGSVFFTPNDFDPIFRVKGTACEDVPAQIILDTDRDSLIGLEWTSDSMFEFDASTSILSTVLPGSYTVTVEDLYGCKYVQILEVGEGVGRVNPPNIFTPNGDEFNPVMAIDYGCITEKYHLAIYNRWGELLFETNNKTEFWNAEDQTDGTYYYIIEAQDYNSLEPIIRKGWVEVAR